MQTKQRELFTTIKTEGAILPVDILQGVSDGKADGIKMLIPKHNNFKNIEIYLNYPKNILRELLRIIKTQCILLVI